MNPSTHQDSPKVPEKPWPATKMIRNEEGEQVVWLPEWERRGHHVTGLDETETYIPVSVILSDEARFAAEAAARSTAPTCDVCHVEYVPDYEGPCQEPLPPFDGSRTCAGTVSLRPEAIAEAALQAAVEQVGGAK